MPSTHKTPFLNLNQWLGRDKPKREDFNRDNLAVDTRMSEHCTDTAAHVTAAERTAWNQGVYTIGTYIGDGSSLTREIELGYVPSIVFVIAVDKTLMEAKSTLETTHIYSAFYTKAGATAGIEATETGFLVYHNSNSVAHGCTFLLNLRNQQYLYFVLR